MNPEQSITFTLTTCEKHGGLKGIQPVSCQITIVLYENGVDDYSCMLNGLHFIVKNSSKINALKDLKSYLDNAMKDREAWAKLRGFESFEYGLSNLSSNGDESLFKLSDIQLTLGIKQ